MATTNENKGFYKLSWLQRIGFGSGDLAQNLIFQTTCMYLLFFYTDIYGLDAVDVSVMFTVGNVANVIWDPIVGALIDKNNPKLGKYRAYLVFVGIPLTGFAILCFWNGFAPSLLYAYITYIAMTLLYTFINVPYGALNSSLTRDTDEITILTSVRMFMANCGGLAVGSGLPLLIAYFTDRHHGEGGDKEEGDDTQRTVVEELHPQVADLHVGCLTGIHHHAFLTLAEAEEQQSQTHTGIDGHRGEPGGRILRQSLGLLIGEVGNQQGQT